jgi:Domain of unknown function (DUF397)
MEVHLGSGVGDGLEWRRSSRCNGGDCVEVAERDDEIIVRSSTDPDGTTLVVGSDSWHEWIVSVKQGAYDVP